MMSFGQKDCCFGSFSCRALYHSRSQPSGHCLFWSTPSPPQPQNLPSLFTNQGLQVVAFIFCSEFTGTIWGRVVLLESYSVTPGTELQNARVLFCSLNLFSALLLYPSFKQNIEKVNPLHIFHYVCYLQ